MSSPLHHPSPVNNVNHIRILNRTQSMGNSQRRSSPRSFIQSFLHNFFRFTVKRRGCFVEEKDFGVADESTSDGNTLLLTTGQGRSSSPDNGLVAGGETLYKIKDLVQLVESYWVDTFASLAA